MRPKFLEIQGLQSFQEAQRIDFAVLGETGLFGIFGPTGSGKSTILDAITFALYGKVKRAERGTQGIINANLNDTKVSFTFELTKDGCRRTYRVDRAYRRKKGSENSCEPKIARLVEITPAGDIPLCDKASEVSNSIEELLGLNHDDFTRAVVLPQNSFQEFLMLDNSRKREMLERVFYLEEYGKNLLDKLGRKMSSLRSQLDRLSGELAAYGDATDEALEQARLEMERLTNERSRLEKEFKSLEEKYFEAKEVWQLVQELSAVEEQEGRHASLREQIETKRIQLDKAQKAEGLRNMIRNKKELSQKLQDTKASLQSILEKLPGIVSELELARKKYQSVKSEAQEQQPKLVERKTRLAEALRIQDEIKALEEKSVVLRSEGENLGKAVSEKSAALDVLTGKLASLKADINEFGINMESLKTPPEYRLKIQEGAALETEIASVREKVDTGKETLGQLDAVIAGLEEGLAENSLAITACLDALGKAEAQREQHLAAKPGDRNSVLDEKQRLLGQQRLYDALRLRQDEIKGIEQKLDKFRETMDKYLSREKVLLEERSAAGAFFDGARLELERAQKNVEKNTAVLLSRNLVEGEPCPVCGSLEHPLPAAEENTGETTTAEKQLEKARTTVTEAEKALKEAETKCLLAREHISGLEQQIMQSQEELECKFRDYKKAQSSLPAELQSLELEQLQQEIEARERRSSEKLAALEVWEQQSKTLQGEAEAVNQQLSQVRLKEKEIQAELKVNRENREREQKVLAESCEFLSHKEEEYRRFLEQYNIPGAAEELRRLAENDRRLSMLEKEMDASRKRQAETQASLEALQEELRLLINESTKIETDFSSIRGQITEKEARLTELTGDVDIEAEIRKIDAQLESYLRQEEQLEAGIRELEEEHHQLTSREKLLSNQGSIFADNLEKEEAALREALTEKGFADDREVDQSIISREEQKLFRDEINSYDEAGKKIQAQKGVLSQKLGARAISREEWEQISGTYHETLTLKEEWVSSSLAAQNRYTFLEGKHQRWVELKRDSSRLENKFGLLEQIQKLLRAERGKDNSFIDYIAEERLRYVAAKASEILGVITRYKYALELDTDAGFIIRDYANGGICRNVSTLSGGETFLTSLSLALALSEQIQLKGQSPLELFFLDEGFGTLDNDLLDTVMDSLERLSSRERVIGLISHVPELRNRMARRLIVDPPTANGEGSRVRIEMA